MRVKDYKGSLYGLKVKTPKGVIGYWKSQWNKGVWLSDGKTSRIYPQFVDELKDCLEWDVAEENEKVNCDKKLEMAFIDNYKEAASEYEKKNDDNLEIADI